MTWKETLAKLDSAYQAHLDEQEIIKKFTVALQKKAKDMVSELYPEEIHMLSAEGYKALEGRIYDRVSDLAVDITNIFYRHIEDDRA